MTFPNVEHLFWDSKGQLWISTFGGGAFRLDPQTEVFTRFQYDPRDSTTINNNFVHYAAEDADGNIWFATRTGASKLNQTTGTFKNNKTDPSKPYSDQNNRVRVLYLDKQGTLWATAGEVYAASLIGGLFKYDPSTDAFEGYFPNPDVEGGLGHSPIHGLHEDSEGNFWVGTYYGLQKMDRRTGTFTDMPYNPNQPHAPDVNGRDDAPVWSIHEDQNKGLWMGTVSFNAHDKNLSRYDPVNHTTETFPLSGMAWDIAESSDGTIWVAGSAIQGVVHRISRQTKKYDLQDGQDIAASLTEMRRIDDNGGSISLRNFNIDPKTNTLWATRPSRNENTDRLGWLSTVYLASKDLNTGTIKTYQFDTKSGENNNPGWNSVGLEIDNDGNIWTPVKYGGVIKFNPSTGDHDQFLNVPGDSTSLSSNDIVRLIKDSRGNIWAASYRKGLNRINTKTGKIKRFNFSRLDNNYPNPRLDDNFPIGLLEASDGKIWVGGSLSIYGDIEGGGFLATVDPVTDNIEYIELPRVIVDNSIRFIAEDPTTGNIAFTLFDQGFCVYEPATAKIKTYDSIDGKSPFRSIAGLMYDDDGYLWLSSFNADEFARIDLTTGNIYMFETTLDINSSSNNRHALKTEEGHLLFKNNSGWARIDPKIIAPSEVTRTASLKMVDLSVAGERQNYLKHASIDTIIGEVDQVHLDHTAESFEIKFSDFNYSPNRSSYFYRLYPYEKEYRPAQNGPIASYFKVPPGSYEFQVNAASSKGTIISPLNIPITIHPPWWKTWWAYGLYAIGIGLLGWSIHKTQRERTIRMERERAKDRELEQAKEIEKAYAELKTTQAQLIQAEKMASLGELTAGIAHEIQNPLNFVNNFSEVSEELLNELKEELNKGDIDEAKSISDDVIQNLSKISHHGQRASSIVKGMLDHSRATNDEKIPTDINALCDEYLRLSYHGLRAKDKSFNAAYETNFDESLPLIEAVPQDLGRVLLNILNNAFYSVNEKANVQPTDASVSSGLTPSRRNVRESNGNPARSNYKPLVRLTTQQINNSTIRISVSDNGIGMSRETLDKIFQPFFTTKPTGQGTGLGMSISYDIITKGHGGEIKVESKEGKGTTFTIELPVENKK